MLLWVLGVVATLAWLGTALLHLSRTTGEISEGALVRVRMEAALRLVRDETLFSLASPGTAAIQLPGHGDKKIGAFLVAWRLTSEDDLVNLNQADPPTLARLLTQQGLTGDAADRLADAIADWRDPDDLRRLHGAEAADYRTLGAPPPKNRQFVSIGELAEVTGMTPAILACLQDRLTLFGAGTEAELPAQPQERAVLPGIVLRLDVFVSGDDGAALAETRVVRITGNRNNPIWTLAVHKGDPQTKCPA